VKANYEDSYIRIIVSRGEDDRFDLSIRQTVKPRTVVVVTKIPQFPTEYFEKGISVEVVSVKRNLRAAIDPNIKSGNYLNNILALREARKKGAVDAVLLNAEGNVTEATTSNVFLVKAGRIVTPDTESGILDGVTRGLLLEALGHHRIPFEVRAVSEKEFLAADEIFGTSTLKEVIPITRLNGRDVGAGRPGPVTLAVRGHLRTRIEEMLNAMERDPASNQTS
jgi:branched-chain amino acid aminotransferase